MNEARSEEVTKKIAKGYELMMYKPISDSRLNALMELYTKSYLNFKNNGLAGRQLAGQLETPDSARAASLVMVASAMLNLDEWLNKN